MQVSTANVVPDGQQRLLSTTNDVTIYIYIHLLFVLLILLLLLLLLLMLARARFSMIVGPWLAGARFSLIFSYILIRSRPFWGSGWLGLDFR